MVSDTAANSSAVAMAFLLTVVGAFLCASPAVAMDDNMRHHARRALGVALSVAERSLDQLLPPSNGPPASPYNQVWQPNWVTPHGLVPQPCAASGAVFDPARQTWARVCGGPGVNLMGCSTYVSQCQDLLLRPVHLLLCQGRVRMLAHLGSKGNLTLLQGSRPGEVLMAMFDGPDPGLGEVRR